MAGNNSKIKILYLMKLFYEKTDDDHSLTMAGIISALEDYGVTAERKSIYSDIETLKEFGLDIIGEQKDRTYYYKLVGRDFEEHELKLLVDSIQSAKFLTEKRSNELIKKLESLTSEGVAKKLQRQVYVSGRVKTMNENVLLNVDYIHEAINNNHQISFQYFNWDHNKKQVLRKNGLRYVVSPWALIWNDENYYMVAFDGNAGIIKFYRVDKMLSPTVIKAKREGLEEFKKKPEADYEKKIFNMFDGEDDMVQMVCENDMAGVMIDRFGLDCMMHDVDSEHFKINVKVSVSDQFLAWVIGLGSRVKVVGSERVVERLKEMIRALNEQYS